MVDLWAVDKRYLNNDDFVPKRQAQNPFPMMPVDEAILEDDDLSYRVLPLQNPFQDARASYYHKNVGGYHAAKLGRYQELIDAHLRPEMQELIGGLQAGSPMDSVFRSLDVINMLNTRYIIYDLNQNPVRNPHAMRNAWFVDDYRFVENADAEIAAMEEFDPEQTAIIDQRFKQFVGDKEFDKDQSGAITLTEYQPNYLKYEMQADSEQLAVLSEIYYDKGWNAFIDGEEVPHFRVNYVLRGLVVPAGNHTIEFRFEPRSFYQGNKISLASSILLVFIALGYAAFELKKKYSRKEGGN